MLKIKKLSKIYETEETRVLAVDRINVEMHQGEFVAILGLSGSGKSTLMSMIGGLETPSTGSVIWNDIDTTNFSKHDWVNYRKNTVGFVFQEFNLISHLSAYENVILSLSLSGYNRKEKEKRATELLTSLEMYEYRNQLPEELSGGQKQRVAIARALANNPDIILADEPTGALDPDTADTILNILKSLAEKGHMVIMVTHDDYLAEHYASRIIELDEGKIITDNKKGKTAKKKEQTQQNTKSALQLTAAFRLAMNNLIVRRKSTAFAVIALIPAILLAMILGNFVVNLYDYQSEIAPIYNRVLGEDETKFISTIGGDDFVMKTDYLLGANNQKKFDDEKNEIYKSMFLNPINKETYDEIEALPFVKGVFKPQYLNVTLKDKSFIIVGLLPSEFKKYQYDLNNDYYPEDTDTGIIMSEEAALTLLGKYNTEPESLEGRSMSMTLEAYNGVGFHQRTIDTKETITETIILKVFDSKSTTNVMKNYYEGYIFVTSDYFDTLIKSFDESDYSLVKYQEIQLKGETSYYPIGANTITDLFQPLRHTSMLQEDLNLLVFPSFSDELPCGDFQTYSKIISDGKLNKTELAQLNEIGNIRDSAFDEHTYRQAKNNSNKITENLLNIALGLSVVVLIPSGIVVLILYISIIMRTTEIGILKALGARSKDIIKIFTMEAGLIAVGSGIVSLIVLLPLSFRIQTEIDNLYNISYALGSNPFQLNVIAIGMFLIGMILFITLLGILPGLKASKLNPNDLIRRLD